jgi:nucleoside-diphosphate-sugar epimerase
MTMSKCFVTGATSFIGQAVCESLLKEGHFVYALVRPASANRSSIEKMAGLNIVLGDISDVDSALSSFDDIDVAFHLAWAGVAATGRADPAIQESNYKSSLNLIRSLSSHGCKMLIGGGSQAEYGIINGSIYETSACNPVSEYGKAKLRVTLDGAEICIKKHMAWRMPRIFSVYGPGDHPWTLVSELLRSLKEHRSMPLSFCEQYWSFLYIEDAANALIALMSKSCQDGIYNVASETSRPLKEYVLIIKELFPEAPAPIFGGIATEESRPVQLLPVVDKLKQNCDWSEKYTFRDGIVRTISTL